MVQAREPIEYNPENLEGTVHANGGRWGTKLQSDVQCTGCCQLTSTVDNNGGGSMERQRL